MQYEGSPMIGAIGLGYWGKNILRNLHALGALHTACDASTEIVAQRKAEFPDVSYTHDVDDILANDAIKALTIATPASTHYALARKTILAGKDVFVEKPLSLTLEEGKELVDLARARGRVLMVGHLLQYHPAVLALRDLVATGVLGRIQYIYSNRLNIGKLRVEENALWSFAPHDISVILMLVGEEPLHVSAFGGAYVSPGIHDTTLTMLHFRDGVRGHVYVSWLHPYKEQKFVVIGRNAMAVFNDCIDDKLCVFPHRVERVSGAIPLVHKAEHYVVPLENKEPLQEELLHFIACVLRRETPRTDGAEALRVLSVLEQATTQLRNDS